jgi:CheY-like chemotaxis protein
MMQGLRVLVVEDEGPIAMMVEDMFLDMGCQVTGLAATVPQALELVKQGGFDFALLDMNLNGIKVEPVADALAAGGVPFAFASGYGRAGLPVQFQDRPVVQKPFVSADLEKVVHASVAGFQPSASTGPSNSAINAPK